MLSPRAAIVGLVMIVGTGMLAFRDRGAPVHVPCADSGADCARALQAAVDAAGTGTTLTLEPGKVYDGTIVIKPLADGEDERQLTITTRGWTDKGQGWDGLVTPDDKPRMAVLRATERHHVGLAIEDGVAGVTVFGVAFEHVRPHGQGDIIRIGSGKATQADRLPRRIALRQLLLQGDRRDGQKRGIAANGQDVEISQVWCEEIFIAGQDAQCVAAWNGGKRVRVRHSYLAAGAENLLVGGAPIASAEMEPEDWLIEDVILHKPLRWKDDGARRQVKNLLEFKFGRRLTARRVLAVNNWRAAQDGMSLLLTYTTNGRCPQCGNLEDVLIEDLVMLNVSGGISFQGYSWPADSHSAGKLRNITIRNAYLQLTGRGRTIQIGNVRGRHDIRIERSTFINAGGAWLTGSFGYSWTDNDTRVRGGPMDGLWLIGNVFASNGRYGATAPDGRHYGSGLEAFVGDDLTIAGNVLGDAPPKHLENYNRHARSGAENISVPADELLATLPERACGEWRPTAGADCERLAPVFDLLTRLPEP